MRRIVTTLIMALPLASRSRRALDETLLDWTMEAQRAAGLGRVRVPILGLAALIRVLTCIAADHVIAVPVGGLLWRAAVCAAPFALYAATITTLARELPGAAWAVMGVQAGVVAAAMQIPAAAFVAAASLAPRRHVPAGAGALIMAAITLATLGWIVPHSGQWMRETVYAATSRTDSVATRLPRGVPELTLDRLVVAAVADPWGHPAAQLAVRVGITVQTAVFVYLGVAVRQRSRRGRRLALWTAMPTYLTTVFALSLIVHAAVVNWLIAVLAVFLVLRLRARTPLETQN